MAEQLWWSRSLHTKLHPALLLEYLQLAYGWTARECTSQAPPQLGEPSIVSWIWTEVIHVTLVHSCTRLPPSNPEPKHSNSALTVKMIKKGLRSTLTQTVTTRHIHLSKFKRINYKSNFKKLFPQSHTSHTSSTKVPHMVGGYHIGECGYGIFKPLWKVLLYNTVLWVGVATWGKKPGSMKPHVKRDLELWTVTWMRNMLQHFCPPYLSC